MLPPGTEIGRERAAFDRGLEEFHDRWADAVRLGADRTAAILVSAVKIKFAETVASRMPVLMTRVLAGVDDERAGMPGFRVDRAAIDESLESPPSPI